MGHWIAWIVIGVVPGLMIWLHLRLRRSLDADEGFFSMLLGGLIILYGFLVAGAYCDFEWNGFGWVSDVSPRFSYGIAPTSRDYWFEAWPIYLWCVVGLGVMAQGCFRLWRDYFDRTMQIQRRTLFTGAMLLVVGSAALGIWGYSAYNTHLAFDSRTDALEFDLNDSIRRIDRFQKTGLQTAIDEAQWHLYGLAFEIDARSKGRPLLPKERGVLQSLATYRKVHPDSIPKNNPSYGYELSRSLARADAP